MTIITWEIIAFITLEFLNIIILYFAPTSKKGNGIGFFNAYEKSKEIPEVHALIKYLVNWVAGTKLIFIALLLMIIIKGDEEIQLLTAFALIITILSFFWRLYPSIKKMDQKGNIPPKGYSKTLGIMIFCFILVFVVAILVTHFG